METGPLLISEDFNRYNVSVKVGKWPDSFSLEPLVDRMISKIPQWRTRLRTTFLQSTVDLADRNPEALTTLRRYADHAPFRALFLEPNPTVDFPAISVAKIAHGLIFENTRIGNISLGFGVSVQTVRMLAQWVNRWADNKTE
jgi:hypothetical protein